MDKMNYKMKRLRTKINTSPCLSKILPVSLLQNDKALNANRLEGVESVSPTFSCFDLVFGLPFTFCRDLFQNIFSGARYEEAELARLRLDQLRQHEATLNLNFADTGCQNFDVQRSSISVSLLWTFVVFCML